MDKNTKKTAVVIGGSSGIGYNACAILEKRGWKVVNISRTTCKNSHVVNIKADVTQAEFGDVLKNAFEKHGADALIYSAGFSMAAPIEHAKECDYRYLFDVNFFGALKAVQTAVPFMKARGGKIILVGSVGGDLPICFDSFYSASKAALEMLCRAAYFELKEYNISVTALLPGGTATEFTFKRKVYPDEENKGYAHKLNKAVAALANMEQGGDSPLTVAETIYDILASSNPPVVKTCGVKNGAYRIISRVMPQKLALNLNGRMYNQ